MANKAQDEAFAKYVLQAGIVRIEHLEAAQEKQSQSGESLPEILVTLGAITPLQRQDIEKRVAKGMGSAPTQLGNYRLICKLGEGGMGAVYLGEDTVLDRQVALKLLPKDVTKDPERLSRFRREAVAAGKLNHQNIASAYSLGEDAGHYFYVMEYCRGEPLSKILKRQKRLPEWQVVELSIPITQALAYAHEHRILHRDIKPANIMRGLDGTVKVLDLGLAKNTSDEEQSFQTTSGLAVGTPHYISPEQARGDRELDGRTDVYSLGATMYNLATGRPPFNGSSAAVIMTKHLSDPVPDPRRSNPEVSDGFAAVVMKAMAKKPSERYATMVALGADLQRLAEGHAVRATARRGSRNRINAVAAGGERASGHHEPAQRRRRETAGSSISSGLLTGGVVGAVVIGIVVFFLMGVGGEPAPAKKQKPERVAEQKKAARSLPEATPKKQTEPETKKVPERPPEPVGTPPDFKAAFDQLERDLKTGDLKSKVAKLEAFLQSCKDPILLARARVLLNQLQAPPPPPPPPPQDATKKTVQKNDPPGNWEPLFNKRSIDVLVGGNRGNWLIENGALTNRPGVRDAGQTRRSFTDGNLRIRFAVSGASLLRFTIRQGREGGYSVYMNKAQLAQMKGTHELLLTFRGEDVKATLDGKVMDVRAKGSPRSGRLQFGVSDGRVRISNIDFAP